MATVQKKAKPAPKAKPAAIVSKPKPAATKPITTSLVDTKPTTPAKEPTKSVEPSGQKSGIAITAFIMGLLFFIPFLTQILAVVFGIIALNDKNQGHRGLAITGIILGGVFLLLWLLIFIVIFMAISAYSSYAPAALSA